MSIGAKPYDPAALTRSIGVYNTLRRLVRDLYTLRQMAPWKVPTSELYLVLRASLVLPAESIDVVPMTTSAAEIEKLYGGCTIQGSITRLQQIGHLVQMAVTLPNGENIGIEGHADKYGGRFAAGDKARIAWKASGATVIVQ